jgi:hypothetical protein
MQILAPTTLHLAHINGSFTDPTKLCELAAKVDVVEPTVHGIKDAATYLGHPLMLKSKTLAYGARGNFVLRDLSHVQDTLNGEQPALNGLIDRPSRAIDSSHTLRSTTRARAAKHKVAIPDQTNVSPRRLLLSSNSLQLPSKPTRDAKPRGKRKSLGQQNT